LITNTSGLGEYTAAAINTVFDPRREYAPRDLVALALPQGQIFDPGAYFDYCNTGWVIAAMIIEKVRHTPYHDVIEQLILTPLGMAKTFFGMSRSFDGMMRGYIQSHATPEPIESSGALSWAYGAGDGISTLDDMLAFYGSFVRADSQIGVSLDELGSTVGKPSSKPHFELSIGALYGLGLEKRAWAGCEVWGHPGGTLAYSTATWVDPKARATVTTCISRVARVGATDADIRYPRAQLFAMALNTAYDLANGAA
jgi:D-alanyl-D-alanine carboxypeptidase